MKEAELNPPEPKVEPTPQVVEEPNVPDKFKGKSLDEVLQSYSNLESQLGRQGQEMASLRRLNDQLLELKVTASSQAAEPVTEVTADDVLNDPSGTIRGTVAPVIDQTNSRVDQLEARLSLSAFEGRHPTYLEDQNDPEFQAFVQASPYRSSLAQKLVSNGDLSAAEELWTAWEENRPTGRKEQVTPVADETEAKETAEGMVTRGGGEADAAGPKPISRHELSRIRIEDEERYYSPDFQAYVQYMYQNRLVK
jgi:hypothetical protein